MTRPPTGLRAARSRRARGDTNDHMTAQDSELRESSTAGRVPQRGFVGRERELAELLLGFDEAVGEHGRLFVVTGEAGIGKTSLAAELAELVARRGARVAWGRCREGG